MKKDLRKYVCVCMCKRDRGKRRGREKSLFVVHDTDLGGPQHASVKAEALLLRVEHGIVLLVGHGRHKRRLVLVGVELVAGRVEAFEAVLLERLHQHGLGHLEAVDEVDKVLVGGLSSTRCIGASFGGRLFERLLRHHGQRAVQVVDAVDKVLGELGNGKVAGRLDLALGALLQVAEVGDRPEVFVLEGCGQWGVQRKSRRGGVRPTFQSTTSLDLVSSSLRSAAASTALRGSPAGSLSFAAAESSAGDSALEASALDASASLLYHRPPTTAADEGCRGRAAAAVILRKGDDAVWGRKGEAVAVVRGTRAARRAALEGAEASWRSILEGEEEDGEEKEEEEREDEEEEEDERKRGWK